MSELSFSSRPRPVQGACVHANQVNQALGNQVCLKPGPTVDRPSGKPGTVLVGRCLMWAGKQFLFSPQNCLASPSLAHWVLDTSANHPAAGWAELAILPH